MLWEDLEFGRWLCLRDDVLREARRVLQEEVIFLQRESRVRIRHERLSIQPARRCVDVLRLLAAFFGFFFPVELPLPYGFNNSPLLKKLFHNLVLFYALRRCFLFLSARLQFFHILLAYLRMFFLCRP
ncbi:hypothetical protein K435DRAFT_868623 [Dendrothele bispora CBS 962.96]|uniref:Uncharacterized protein n=1 Tax=Dendrothele bispora (strain CBS 962.96) TaxID=1314807 RepID=A0A4S8LBD3_DENBC|nr:hypothetical protein K435DRAFT_868623 [Dendrothele bispora CBS 962.96]